MATLRATTREQREHVERILDKAFGNEEDSPKAFMYLGFNNEVTINIPYDDGYDEVDISISFDTMAEIVDYLREQNKEQVK